MLAYDLRNHGMSGQGNGGIAGIGLTEYRDVIGSLRYAASRPDTTTMKKALLSVCLGADSTAVGWSMQMGSGPLWRSWDGAHLYGVLHAPR